MSNYKMDAKKAGWPSPEERAAQNRRNFNRKREIVLAGDSRIFKNWQDATHGALTADAFIAGLAWLCNDPLDDKGRATRELGLEGNGDLVKLERFYQDRFSDVFVSFRYCVDYDSCYRRKGCAWVGSKFTWTASPEEKAFWGSDVCSQTSKISINVFDHI